MLRGHCWVQIYFIFFLFEMLFGLF